MSQHDLRERTQSFALRVIKLTESLPKSRAAEIIGRQLLRSATSVGANYRAVSRSRSHAEFLSKLGIVEEEADESTYWLELLAEAGLMKRSRLEGLIQESDELTAIIVASIRTAKQTKAMQPPARKR